MTAETARALIETRGLAKTYDVFPALRALTLDIQRGETVALLGPNGSGKSTLLRLLAGLTKPSAGTLHIGGWSLPDEAGAVRAQIGMVSHKALLYENLTARENLIFFARLYGLKGAEQTERVDGLLARVGLAKRGNDLVRAFSRGMQQRLSIARALLNQPAVLLLDEPYTGLDQDASAMLDALVQEASAEGRTVIMSTHDLDRTVKLVSRLLILSRGRLVHDAPAAGLTPLTLAEQYTAATGMTSAREA